MQQPKLIHMFVPLLLATAFIPLLANAQTQSAELNGAVQTAITADPRSAGMSPVQIDTMASLLANKASEEGITPQAIAWQPYDPNQVSSTQPVPNAPASALPAFFYLYIAAASLILALATALFFLRHRHHMSASPVGPKTGTTA